MLKLGQQRDTRACPASVGSWRGSGQAGSWWERQTGEFSCGKKGLRGCAKPALSLWMGQDERKERSLGKDIGVAASQDKNSSDGEMGLFLAPDQLDRRLSSFQWVGFCICCMAAISV